MTTRHKEQGTPFSWWSGMRDTTRLAVALAFGVSVMTVVLLLSKSGPLFTQLAAWIAQVLGSTSFTQETLTTCYLIAMSAGLFLYGIAHAQRMSSAYALNLPKDSKKPPVSSIWASACFWYMALVYSCASVGIAALTVNFKEMSTGLVFVAILGPILGAWVSAMVVMAAVLAIAVNEPTFSDNCLTLGNGFRALALLSGGVGLCMGFSALNLGLFAAMLVVAFILAPLESDKLPENYGRDSSIGSPA